MTTTACDDQLVRNPDETGTKRHKWADVIIAWANGDAIQFKNATVGRFLDYDNRADFVPCFNDQETEWRIKPRTIKIGDMEVPEPLREVPEFKSNVFAPSLVNSTLFHSFEWENLSVDSRLLLRHMLHNTKEAAIAHAKALIVVSGGTV